MESGGRELYFVFYSTLDRIEETTDNWWWSQKRTEHIPSEEVDDFEVVGEAPVAVNGDVA